MKLSETRTCGAGITAEDDDSKAVTKEVRAWGKRHQCGVDPWRRNNLSTTASQIEMGFNNTVPSWEDKA